MKCLKQRYRIRRVFTNISNKLLTIPDVLKRKLIVNGCLILFILAAGIFMEWNNSGEGFIKLTIVCAGCLLCRLLYLFMMIAGEEYEYLEGEVVRIEICKKRKKYWQVTVKTREGQNQCFLLHKQSGIRKGVYYRFYWKDEEILGIEDGKIY